MTHCLLVRPGDRNSYFSRSLPYVPFRRDFFTLRPPQLNIALPGTILRDVALKQLDAVECEFLCSMAYKTSLAPRMLHQRLPVLNFITACLASCSPILIANTLALPEDSSRLFEDQLRTFKRSSAPGARQAEFYFCKPPLRTERNYE